MELYTNKDLAIFEENISNIEDRLIERENKLLEPTYEERKAIEKIILDYIRQYKRKVYGGYAQNTLISARNKDDAFYPEHHVADLDFYSPEPIEDLIRIANLLFEKGYPYIQGIEAVHKETYSVFANFNNACDISYVPKNIFHRMPYVEINGVNYVHPSFIMIDLYRIFTDPLVSGSFRWKKTFPRLFLLQKHYPFNKSTSKLPEIKLNSSTTKPILDTIFNFIKDKESIIVYGTYAYNHYLNKSNVLKDESLRRKYKFIDVPFYEVLSTNYQEDSIKLIELIKATHPEISEQINIVEYYPFWSFLGYSVLIHYNEAPLIHIINYNRRCYPIRKVEANKYNNNAVQSEKGTIQIASYDLQLLMNLITTFRYRVLKDEEMYQYYNIMTSHLIEMRKHFFETTNSNILDETLFQEFIIECIGEPLDPLREARIIRGLKAKQGKLIVFKYSPSDGIKEAKSNYKFSNSSGNAIRNPANFRIIKTAPGIHKPRDRDRVEEADAEEEKVEEVPEDIIDRQS